MEAMTDMDDMCQSMISNMHQMHVWKHLLFNQGQTENDITSPLLLDLNLFANTVLSAFSSFFAQSKGVADPIDSAPPSIA